jgi:ribosome-binding protein aMBF1 (putative translation factor)
MQQRKPQIVVATARPQTANSTQQYIRKPQVLVAKNTNNTTNNTTYDNDDIPKLKTVRPDLSRRIQQERAALGWTQKDLATKACVQLAVVTEFESGKALNNNTEIQKILKTLEAGAKAKNSGEK